MVLENRTLANRTIASVELIDVVTRYPRTVGRNAVLGSHGAGPTAPAVILRTTDGATGWGLVRGRPQRPERIVGRRVDELIDPAVGVIDTSALWADLALHDLAGVLLGQPVYRLLGFRGERTVPVYDASIYFDDLDPPHSPAGLDAVLQNVQEGWNEGYRAFKLKIGRGFTWMEEDDGLERDVAVTRAVHEAFPSARLLVDGNDGFSVEGVVRYLERVRGVGLVWVEEPFPEHRAGLERLRGWLAENSPSTLIADGESQPVVADVVRYARDGLIDVLLMDVLDYGLTPWRRLAASLDGVGVLFSPHTWGLPLKTLYAAHMAAGLPGIVIVEGVRGATLGVDTTEYVIVDGSLTVPDTPGFGIPAPGA